MQRNNVFKPTVFDTFSSSFSQALRRLLAMALIITTTIYTYDLFMVLLSMAHFSTTNNFGCDPICGGCCAPLEHTDEKRPKNQNNDNIEINLYPKNVQLAIFRYYIYRCVASHDPPIRNITSPPYTARIFQFLLHMNWYECKCSN